MGTNMQRSNASATQSNVAVLDSDKTPPEDKTSPDGTKGVRTYSQEEVSKIQSTFRKQLRDKDTELATLNGRVKELESNNDSLKEQVVLLNKELDDSIQDEDVKALRARLVKKEAALADERAAFKQDKSQWEGMLSSKADEERANTAKDLATRFNLDENALLDLDSLEEMHRYAVENYNPQAQPAVEPSKVEPTDKLPKPPVPVSTAVGKDTSNLTPDEKLKEGFRQLNKK